jgi:hypothetical protein
MTSAYSLLVLFKSWVRYPTGYHIPYTMRLQFFTLHSLLFFKYLVGADLSSTTRKEDAMFSLSLSLIPSTYFQPTDEPPFISFLTSEARTIKQKEGIPISEKIQHTSHATCRFASVCKYKLRTHDLSENILAPDLERLSTRAF